MSDTVEKAQHPVTTTAPDGSEFAWGEITTTHVLGPYAIVEYILHGVTWFHSYVDGKDTNHSFPSLDAAMAGCTAYRHEGPNHRADKYFIEMLPSGMRLREADKDVCVQFTKWVWGELINQCTPDSFDIEEKLKTLGIIEEKPCDPASNQYGADTWLVLKPCYQDPAPTPAGGET